MLVVIAQKHSVMTRSLEARVCCLGKAALFLRFQRYDLEPDIPITWIQMPEGDGDEQRFPILKMSDTVKYLSRNDMLNKLLGDPPKEDVPTILLTFWRRYSKLFPDHEIFSAASRGEVSLQRAIPCYVHGDEGRGYKKSGVLLVSVQGIIGKGTQQFMARHDSNERRDRMGLNLLGSSFNSRFLVAVMGKKHYGDSMANYHAIFSAVVDDLLDLQTGFEHSGERHHVVCLGMKGDLPYLAKTGHHERHWLRAERRHKQPEQGGVLPAGVCWRCYAGTPEGGPFEDFNWDAKWNNVVAPLPWSQTPSFLKLFHQPSCPEGMFRADIWHNYHGGVGKMFVASSLTEAMQLGLADGSSRAAKIEQVNALLKKWARAPGKALPHSGPFTQERIGLTSWAVLPDASWSKHDDTRIYHQFLEDWLTSCEDTAMADDVLRRILWGCRCINRAFTILYENGLWLHRKEAMTVGILMRQWLRLYSELAVLTLQAGRLRYPLVVKHHMMDHHCRDLLEQAVRSERVWNVLADSVQLDEDFVGHSARLARRVSPISQALRVLERYRTRAMEVWAKAAQA